MREDGRIAVIGLSCRFPGANNPEEFWQTLVDKVDSVGFLSKQSRPWVNKSLTTDDLEGGYLKAPIDLFDAEFFNLSPKQAVFMDPQQRIFLEVAWKSFENAGIPPSSLGGTKTAVYVGVYSNDYRTTQLTGKTDENELL